MGSSVGLMGWLMVVVCTLVVGATAETYNVGDSLNWNIPPLGDAAYGTWARLQRFQFGDTLVFNWNGTHNVARVSRDEYDNCTSTNPIGQIQTTSPANFTLDTNASHYFICTVDRHCSLGQRVTITVGSSASSLTTTAVSAVILAMAMASALSM